MRKIRFTFLCNSEERELLRNISTILDRTQGDSIRFLLHSFQENQSKDITGVSDHISKHFQKEKKKEVYDVR